MHHEHHAGHISFANALHNLRSGNYGHHTGRMQNIVAGKNGWACCGGALPEAALQLGKAKKGVYKFLCVKCDGHLVHKLLEMGFIPGDDIKVVSNMGSNGSVMIEVKGSKLVLSNKIADNIFVTEKQGL
jgi:Fe2+ transport system protein FeoA